MSKLRTTVLQNPAKTEFMQYRSPVGEAHPENVSLVTAAACALDFLAIHAVAAVGFVGQTICRNRLVKGWPAGARIKFGIGRNSGSPQPAQT